MVELNHIRLIIGNSRGWYQYCEADLLCYPDTINNLGFTNSHDIGTRTYGYLVPVEEIKGFILEQYKL